MPIFLIDQSCLVQGSCQTNSEVGLGQGVVILVVRGSSARNGEETEDWKASSLNEA